MAEVKFTTLALLGCGEYPISIFSSIDRAQSYLVAELRKK